MSYVHVYVDILACEICYAAYCLPGNVKFIVKECERLPKQNLIIYIFFLNPRGKEY